MHHPLHRTDHRIGDRRIQALLAVLAMTMALVVTATPSATADPEGPVQLISRTAAGQPGDDQSASPAISSDGRYVTFSSQAADLTDLTDANAAFGGDDIHTYDRTTGEVRMVSRNVAGTASGNGTSINPVMTPDGRYIAYSSRASNVSGSQVADNQNDPDVFVWDRTTGLSVLVSLAESGADACTAGAAGSFNPSISDDGRYVAFQSDCGDLTFENDTNALQDVFLWDRTTADVTHLSYRGTSANGFSQNPRINGGGTHVTFESNASNISAVPDNNGLTDVYVWVIAAGASTPISTTPGSGETGNGASRDPQISSNGQYIAYQSAATDITPTTDGNGADDIVLFSVGAVSNTLVSRSVVNVGESGDGGSASPRISPDASTIAYVTAATDTAAGADANGASDVIVYDRESTGAERASRTSTGAAANGTSNISFTTFNPQKLSTTGRYLIFESEATNMVSGVTGSDRNIYTYDRMTDSVALVSAAASGSGGGDGDSLQPVISADGSAAAFTSEATNLRDPADGNGQRDVYARLGEVDQPALSIADSMVTRTAAGPEDITFEVTLSPPAPASVTVDYTTVDGSAVAGEDYEATSGTATFAPGEGTASITVPLLPAPPGPSRTFQVTLSNPTGGAVIDRATATGTITDEGMEVADEREGVSDTIRIYRSGDPNTTRDVALRYSQATFGEGSPVPTPTEVLLATDANFADALASGALQTTRSADGMTTGGRPLLLTPTDSLSTQVVQELERLGATSVRILGGVAAISQAVQDQLTGMGLDVQRYAGPSRLETATAIAQGGFGSATTAILARAFPAEAAGDPTQAFADSLAAGAWGAANGWPLLLTQSEVLSTSTRTYLESSGITTVRVVGGTAAISDSVLDELRGLGLNVDRIAGPSRFDTALAIAAQRGYADERDAPRVMVIDGQGPEAWAAGFAAAAYSAINDAPVLLGTADVIPGPTASWLDPMASSDPSGGPSDGAPSAGESGEAGPSDGGSSDAPSGGGSAFAVDSDTITGPVLVCAIAGERCDETRSLLGLPDLAQLSLDQDGMTVPQGSTLSGTVTNVVSGATLEPNAGCLDETAPVEVPAAPDPVALTLELPDDGRLGPCDITFVVAFPNGSVQTIVQSIDVAAPS